MSHTELFQTMADSIIVGDAETSARLARQSLELAIPPLDSIDEGFVKGIRIVGDRFGAGELFLPELVMSAEAMKAALAILEPELAKTATARETAGSVLACTVQGDIHDIGKRIVCTMLSANGFVVVDLGVNVKIDRFVQEIKTRKPDIVAMSALLTTTAPNQGKVIKALVKEGIRQNYVVMVGGAPTSLQWSKDIGADGYGENATEAVRVAKELMTAHRARKAEAASQPAQATAQPTVLPSVPAGGQAAVGT